MASYSVVIASKNDAIRTNIQTLIRQYGELSAHAIAYSLDEAIAACRAMKTHVLIVDSEFLTSERIVSLSSELSHTLHIIAIGQSSSKAQLAFEIGALDHLVIPVSSARFQLTFDRLTKQLQRPEPDSTPLIQQLTKHIKQSQTPPQIIVKDGGRIRFIEQSDINWIGGAGNYVELHLEGDERTLLHRETLSAMEARLAHTGFIRIHRSTLVRSKAIAEIKPTESGDYIVTLKNGETLNFSRRYKPSLEALLAS